jgi:hypothetical protein
MARPKKLTYALLIERLIASKKLNNGEQAAFEAMRHDLTAGAELTEHQKLWVDHLRHRIDHP